MGAYRVNLTDIGDDGTPEPLRQHGPVEGNIVRYSGRYPFLAAALAAIEAYVDVPVYTLVRQSQAGMDCYTLQNAHAKGGYDRKTGWTNHVLLRKTEDGVYRSHEAAA